MRIDFFELELKKARDRFNQTFGKTKVCDLQSRFSAIFAICFMGIACRKIRNAGNKNNVRGLIKKFMNERSALNNLFDQFEREQQGRRINTKSISYKSQKRNV